MTGPSHVTRVPKPWGHEIIWARTDRYVGKILHIKAGEKLSVQYHNRKEETVYLLQGELRYWVQTDLDARGRTAEELSRDGIRLRDMALKTGDAFRITPGTIHSMEAITDCDILEASTPELDDVVRLEDKYGREGTSAP